MADRVGQQLGNYRLIRLLGQGGFAEVYLGEHVRLRSLAAIKVLHAHLTGEDWDHFQQEANIIASLKHPQIVRILDFDVEQGLPFLVMDYAPNGTLRQRHPKGEALPPRAIVPYVKQAAEALEYAHEQRLIHRDVKPENMLLGTNHEVLLSDFGIALLTQSSRYQTTQEVVGTVAYMAPEQIQGHPRPASDQYALGVVVYEWLSGNRPFHGSFTEIAMQHIMAAPVSLRERVSDLSPAVEQVVLTALAKDPKERFATVKAFATALEQANQSGTSLLSASTVVRPSGPALSSPSLPSTPTPPTVIPSDSNFFPPRKPGPSGFIPPSAFPPASAPAAPASVPPQPLLQRPISRRLALVGLAGVGVAAASSGITWLALSHKGSGPSSPAAVTSPTSRVPPTATFAPTAPSVPLGTTIYTYQSSGQVFAVAWSPVGQRVASGGTDNVVRIWDATTGGHVVLSSTVATRVAGLAWSPDGKYIASANGDITSIWNASDGTLVLNHPGQSGLYGVICVAWSPNGQYLVSGADDNTIQVWEAASGTLVHAYAGHKARPTTVAWSPNGQRIASASLDGTVQLWDAMTGDHRLIYTDPTQGVNAAVWSPDGTLIASAGGDSKVRVWDASRPPANTKDDIYVYGRHSSIVGTLAWKPHGNRIVSGGQDLSVQVWDATTGDNVIFHSNHTEPVLTVAWSPDGTMIVSGGEDKTAQVWSAD